MGDKLSDAIGPALRRSFDDTPVHLTGVPRVVNRLADKKRGDRDGVRDIDRYSGPNDTGADTKLPTVTFSRGRAPGIAGTFDEAVAGGAPTTLTRVDALTKADNRTEALRDVPAAPDGQSLDEYPFASTAEGGSGSVVRPVPRGEQNYQGGKLSSFYRDNGVKPGDQFNVEFGP